MPPNKFEQVPKAVGYISGTWDLLHIGHIRVLGRAKALCDVLVVGVTPDETSHKDRSSIPYKQRWEIIKSLRCVDAIVPHTSFEDTACFDKYGINMRIIGPEFGRYAGQRRALSKHREAGIKIVVLSRTPNISTTLIKEAICESKSVIDNCNDSSSDSRELWREETGTPSLRHNSG